MSDNRFLLEVYVGENGNWYMNDIDTGAKAQGEPGKDGITPHIGENGNWFVGNADTNVPATGPQGPNSADLIFTGSGQTVEEAINSIKSLEEKTLSDCTQVNAALQGKGISIVRRNGIVTLSFSISIGSSRIPIYETLFKLPAGYEPTNTYFSGLLGGDNFISINSDGYVQAQRESSGWMTLSATYLCKN
ncbi:hypothetical protein [Extibacter muris]|uniref:hypothetical protein n=1 Tax=Extibacter muris TaxID=1796622 RepID=UPI001D05D8BE|nr:hypothetical protein [Extibacter muris]MCB6202794.1 hypothetical protein [Extibacter muris]MCQ4664790.1 hypothetical protein [Extibacter muris]MCQ4694079.1 hypothetical protein [Extibacter muris]